MYGYLEGFPIYDQVDVQMSRNLICFLFIFMVFKLTKGTRFEIVLKLIIL